MKHHMLDTLHITARCMHSVLLLLPALRSTHRHTAEYPQLLARTPEHRVLAPERYASVKLEPRASEEAQHARVEEVPLGLVCYARRQFRAQRGDEDGEAHTAGPRA